MDPGELTLIFERIEQGDSDAASRLLPLVYDELRHLAAAKMARESGNQTLQPTALVHEAWLRLGGDGQPMWKNRRHFFGAAAESMRRILIDNARRKQANRRGGGHEHVELSVADAELISPDGSPEDLLLLNEALDALELSHSRSADLVKQRYFVGLTLEEAAEVLEISLRTAKRDWAYARAWLFAEIQRLRQSSS